jgi:hypothetical protein
MHMNTCNIGHIEIKPVVLNFVGPVFSLHRRYVKRHLSQDSIEV